LLNRVEALSQLQGTPWVRALQWITLPVLFYITASVSCKSSQLQTAGMLRSAQHDSAQRIELQLSL
jgi:hypothetical protein